MINDGASDKLQKETSGKCPSHIKKFMNNDDVEKLFIAKSPYRKNLLPEGLQLFKKNNYRFSSIRAAFDPVTFLR